MLKKPHFIVLTGMALVCLILVVVNAVLFSHNRSLQITVAGRGQFISQSVQLEALYQQMVKALAELSAKNNDEQLKSLLNAQGITFTLNPGAGSGTGPGAPTPAVKR